jgi:hypothetical protein
VGRVVPEGTVHQGAGATFRAGEHVTTMGEREVPGTRRMGGPGMGRHTPCGFRAAGREITVHRLLRLTPLVRTQEDLTLEVAVRVSMRAGDTDTAKPLTLRLISGLVARQHLVFPLRFHSCSRIESSGIHFVGLIREARIPPHAHRALAQIRWQLNKRSLRPGPVRRSPANHRVPAGEVRLSGLMNDPGGR